jgi:hypothetical protein
VSFVPPELFLQIASERSDSRRYQLLRTFDSVRDTKFLRRRDLATGWRVDCASEDLPITLGEIDENCRGRVLSESVTKSCES